MRFNGRKMPYWVQLLFFIFGFCFIGYWFYSAIKSSGSTTLALGGIPVALGWSYGLFNLIRAWIYERRDRKMYEDPDRLRGSAWDRSARDFQPQTSELSQNCFCPYCGAATDKEFDYCNVCGKPLPK